MKLYMIGNGFDRDHELKTSYNEFKRFIGDNDKNNPKFSDELVDLFPLNEYWSNFEEALSSPENEEKYKRLGYEEFFVVKMQEWFEKWIESINRKIKSDTVIKKFCFPEQSVFFSFNYTDTLELMYDVDPKNIIHIHGNAALKLFPNTNEKFIFGHSDENARNSNESLIARETYKDTKQIWENNQQVISDLIKNDIDEIVIIGFSYGLVDIYYFEKIKKMCAKDVKWILSYHDDSTKEKCIKFKDKLQLKDENIKIIDDKELEERIN